MVALLLKPDNACSAVTSVQFFKVIRITGIEIAIIPTGSGSQINKIKTKTIKKLTTATWLLKTGASKLD
jgi:hypothetical protein